LSDIPISFASGRREDGIEGDDLESDEVPN